MTTYNSYEEAKIANPDKEIHKHCVNEEYATREESSKRPRDFLLAECNPADHCMTVERFLADGSKFHVGDLFIGIYGEVVDVEVGEHLEEVHRHHESDRYRYILRAAALEEKKSRTKVEYVECRFNSRGAALDCFDNNEELYEPSCNPEGYLLCEDPCNVIDMWDQLYRRIETPMTEREAFIEAVSETLPEYDKSAIPLWIGKLYDSGKFKLVEGE